MFRLCFANFSLICRRDIAMSATRRYKDPIYEIFLEKVNEYHLKSPTGKPVDAGPEFEQELNETLERLALKYGGGEGVDMLEFPKFKEPEVTLDPLSVLVNPEETTEKKEDSAKKPKDMKTAAKEDNKKQENKSKDQQKTQQTKAKATDTKPKAKETESKAKETESKTKDTKPKDDKKKK